MHEKHNMLPDPQKATDAQYNPDNLVTLMACAVHYSSIRIRANLFGWIMAASSKDGGLNCDLRALTCLLLPTSTLTALALNNVQVLTKWSWRTP